MSKRKVFVDSDVVLSSLLSSKGAAHFLLNEVDSDFVISNISLVEIERGVNKLGLDKENLTLLKNKLKTIKLKNDKQNQKKIKEDFGKYIFDENDAHVVAGAKKVKAKVILSYNIRDFNRQKINAELGVVVLTPAQYLQYLRSLK